jgi:hypothetical protein
VTVPSKKNRLAGEKSLVETLAARAAFASGGQVGFFLSGKNGRCGAEKHADSFH